MSASRTQEPVPGAEVAYGQYVYWHWRTRSWPDAAGNLKIVVMNVKPDTKFIDIVFS